MAMRKNDSHSSPIYFVGKYAFLLVCFIFIFSFVGNLSIQSNSMADVESLILLYGILHH